MSTITPAASPAAAYSAYADNIRRRRMVDLAFAIFGAIFILIAIGVLIALIGSLIHDGASRLSWSFLDSFPSRRAGSAGIKSAIVGTSLVMFVTAATAIPIGVAAGIYLEEYARKNWFTAFIEINIANLAGVPSIIWGLMALALLIYQFERWFGDPLDNVTGLGRSILTAGLTLGLLVLPIVIVATREAVRAIPQSMREASFACGASRLQTVRHHILPYSLPGVLTGSIIALSRAIGETAPLITIGALTFIAFLPPLPFSPKPWLSSAASAISIPAAAQSLPLTDPATQLGDRAASLRSGTLTLSLRDTTIKPPGPDITTPIPLDFSPSTTISLESLRDRINAVPNVKASITSDGRLLIDPQTPYRLALQDDTNLVYALALAAGGGHYGPFDWTASEFTVLPIQMFNWVSRPDAAFRVNAAAAGIVLLFVTLAMNAVAILLRYRLRRNLQW